MITRQELTDALSDFQAAWDTTMQELDKLTSIPEAERDPSDEDTIFELNTELCNLAEWMQATNGAIRRHDMENEHVPD